LLTTLITPLIMRGAFMIHCAEDDEEQTTGTGSQGSSAVELRAES
jgi:hypothetical protein